MVLINVSEEMSAMVDGLGAEIKDLDYQVENIRMDMYDSVNEAVDSKLKDLSEDLKNFSDITALKRSIEEKEREVKHMQARLMVELEKIKETMIALAEYIDPKKKINFRKEPDQKPRLMSKALTNIVNTLENQ